VIALVVLGLTVVSVGIVVGKGVVNMLTGGSGMAELEAAVAAIPVPAGAELVERKDSPAHGDVEASSDRRYRLATGPPATQQMHTALIRGHCHLLDPPTGSVVEIDALWSLSTTATSGDVYVVPPGYVAGGVSVSWRGSELWISALGDDLVRG